MARITLSVEDQATVLQVATERFEFHATRNTTQTYGHKGRSLDMETEAIGAELAAARVLGLEWKDRSIDQDREGDIGRGVQVRSTRYASGGLLLNPSDNPDHDFFLVIGLFPTYTVRGWITCADGRKVGEVRKLREDRPAVLRVSQEHLLPVESWVPTMRQC